MDNYLSYQKVTLDAGASQRIAASFSRLIVLECTRRIFARIGSGEEIPLDVGFKFDLAPEAAGSLTLRNDDPDQYCTVEFIFGTGNFIDGRFNVVSTRPNQFVQFADAPTTLFGLPPQAGSYQGGEIVANGQAEAIASPTNYGKRKHIYVSNDDPTLNLEIWDYDNAIKSLIVFPKSSVVMETSSKLLVKNPNAAPVSCSISQTFYNLS